MANPDLLGLDFTSAPTHKKPHVLAHATLSHGHLKLTGLTFCASHPSLLSVLRARSAVILAADFPFGLPAHVTAALGGPTDDHRAFTLWVAAHSKGEWADLLRTYAQNQPPGQKHPLRPSDRAARAQSPVKVDYIPVGRMLHAGLPLLRACDFSLWPCDPPGPNADRLAIEAYPGFIARSLIGTTPYKDRPNSQPARVALLAKLKDGLPAYGVAQVTLTPYLEQQALADEKGDVLDSILCCLPAAYAASFGLPNRTNCEGHICDPNLIQR